MSRYPEKEVSKYWGAFDTSIKLCKHAHSKGTIQRFKSLLSTLETSYFRFDEEWRTYKEEIIKNKCSTEVAFNAVNDIEGVTTPAYKYNDSWSELQFERYVTTRDLLQDMLEEQNNGGETAKIVTENCSYDVEFAVNEISSDMLSIQSSVSKLKLDIVSFEDKTMPASTVKAYESILGRLRPKIETDLKAKVLAKLAVAKESTDPAHSNASLRANFKEFQESQTAELGECEMLLVRKLANLETKEDKSAMPAVVDITAPGSEDSVVGLGYRPREQVYLEKTKPPKFNGDELEFPEFKRKWEAQVSKAFLPEEAELDKLKDALPKDAKDQLYGVLTLADAWKILTQRYGDKILISKKLKSQLKSVQCRQE